MATTLQANAHTLYAAFNEAEFAERAAAALLDHGVRAEDISIVSSKGVPGGCPPPADESVAHAIARNERAEFYKEGANEAEVKDKATSGITTTTSGDAASGAEKGAGIGLGIGVLAGLASLAIPGVGIVTGGGALAAAIAAAAGTTAAGAVAGGVTGYLKDQGVPDEAIGRYGQAYDAGDTLLAVTVPSNNVSIVEADEILSKYNGKHISAY